MVFYFWLAITRYFEANLGKMKIPFGHSLAIAQPRRGEFTPDFYGSFWVSPKHGHGKMRNSGPFKLAWRTSCHVSTCRAPPPLRTWHLWHIASPRRIKKLGRLGRWMWHCHWRDPTFPGAAGWQMLGWTLNWHCLQHFGNLWTLEVTLLSSCVRAIWWSRFWLARLQVYSTTTCVSVYFHQTVRKIVHALHALQTCRGILEWTWNFTTPVPIISHFISFL